MNDDNSYKKDLLEFYKSIYDSELERKEKLLERASIAGGFLSILGGILAYYINELAFPSFRWIHLLFYVPFGSGVLTTVISMVYLALSMGKGLRYGYVVAPEEIAKHVKRVETEDAALPAARREDIANSLQETLSGQYCRCGTANRANNTQRSGYVYCALRWAICSMFIVMVALPGFLVLKRDFPEKPTDVRIMNQIEVKK